MSKSCSANRTRSVAQPKVMAKQSKSMNAGTWDNHPNERQFLDSLSRFMNESWAAVSQVRERTGLNPQYEMSATEISKRIGEVSKKLDDKQKEVHVLEMQKTQLLNKSGGGPRVAAMRPAPGTPGPGPSRDPRFTYPDSSGAGSSRDPRYRFPDSMYGMPRATSTPVHQGSMDDSYSGNYSVDRNPGYSDGDYQPSTGSSGSPGSPGVCPGTPLNVPHQVLDGYTLLGFPKATSTPEHQGSMDDSYSGNYDFYDYPEYSDWGYWPPVSDSSGSPGRLQNQSGAGGPLPGESARTYTVSSRSATPRSPLFVPSEDSGGPISGDLARTRTMDSSRSATPRSPLAATTDTDGSGGSWNSPHQGAVRTPPPRCPGARIVMPGGRREWRDPGHSPQPQQPQIAPRRTPSPAPPADRGWTGGAHVVTYDHTPSTEYSTEASSVGSPLMDQGNAGRMSGYSFSSRSDQSAARSSSAYSSPRASPRRLHEESPPPGFSVSPPRLSPSPRRSPGAGGRSPCRGAQRNISQESPPASYGTPPPLSPEHPWGDAGSSPGYSPRSAYSTGRSSSGLSSHPDSSRGTASRSWNSRISSGVSDRSGHQFSPGGSDRSAAEALCHPECLGLPYNYRVGAMRE